MRKGWNQRGKSYGDLLDGADGLGTKVAAEGLSDIVIVASQGGSLVHHRIVHFEESDLQRTDSVYKSFPRWLEHGAEPRLQALHRLERTTTEDESYGFEIWFFVCIHLVLSATETYAKPTRHFENDTNQVEVTLHI